MNDILHGIDFIPNGRGKAQCEPDPLFPNGKAVDVSNGQKSCLVALPYPAAECGAWRVVCSACGLRVGITAAGRPDDPISVKIPCKLITETKH